MELKTYFAQDAAGNIISSAIVNVFLQGTNTPAAGLTRADGTPLENPFAADGAGRIQFRAPDGYYDIQVSAGSGIIQTLTIQCVDYSGAKADADRAESAADRADVSAEQVADAVALRGDLAEPGGLALIGPGVISRGLDKFSVMQGRSGEPFSKDYTRGIAVQLNEPIIGDGSPVSTAQINLIEINADQLNVVDDTSPGTKVDGFMVFHKYGGPGTKGGRHAIEAILSQNAATDSSNTDRNYVGVAGTSSSSTGDGGTSAADAKGTYYGGNFVGILNSGAQYVQVVTGAEFNVGIKTGASANIRTGLQIGSLGNDRGGVIDAGIMFNCGPSNPAFRSGIHFGKQTGGSPLNSTSRAIRVDVDQVDSIVSISSTTVVNRLIDSQSVILTPSVFSMKNSAAIVEIGSDTTSGSTQLRFRTSGTGIASDSAIIASGGSSTQNSGNFEIKAGTITYSCSQRPNVDNVYDYGAANFRGRTAYFGTGSINTSDARHKPIQEQIPDAVLDAWSVVDWGTRFKFDDAISIKGEDGARWHFGLIAQRVEEIFASHGIDGFQFGLLCYDEWDSKAELIDESGKVLTPAIEAGNRYGIRYEEALALEAALQRRNYARLLEKFEQLSARIDALEAK